MTVSSAKLLCHERLSADDPQRISADFAAIYTYAADFAAIYIPNQGCGVGVGAGVGVGRSRLFFPGVGVGVEVDKIYRLRSTPGKLLFPIHRNRHAVYLGHFCAYFCGRLAG